MSASPPRRPRPCLLADGDIDGIREPLYGNFEHPRWDDVAERLPDLLDCTMVCPTCFCTTVEDVTHLTGESVEPPLRRSR